MSTYVLWEVVQPMSHHQPPSLASSASALLAEPRQLHATHTRSMYWAVHGASAECRRLAANYSRVTM